MNNIDNEMLAGIGRQAMNIQAIEAEFLTCNSDDEPIKGTEHLKTIVYNLEKISEKEVEEKMRDGSYSFDCRILVTDPVTFANIFPHAGELKRTGGSGAYWKPCSDKNDYIHCTCSACGFMIEAIDAVVIGKESDDYTGVKYRFCPKCGAKMSHDGNVKMKPKGEDKVLWERK